jgi:hypothetical protein
MYTLGLANFVLKLFIPGALGILGLHLSSKIGFKGILNDEIKQKRNIFWVIFVGIIMGVYFIGYETLFSKVYSRLIFILPYDYLIIPASIFASFAEGIGDQISYMFRISLLVWFFSRIIISEKGRNILFWVVSAVCAVVFSLEHITTSFIYGTHNYVQFHEIMIIIGLYWPLAMVCAYFLKKFGLLSAIIIHFITDISWRILWAFIVGYVVFG